MINNEVCQKVVTAAVSIVMLFLVDVAQCSEGRSKSLVFTTEQKQARNEALWGHYDSRYQGAFTGFTMNLQQIAVCSLQPAIRVQVGPPGCYKGGMVLMPNGDLIATPMNPDTKDGLRAMVYRSKDDGLTWEKIAEPNNLPGKEHGLAALSDGTLLHIYYSGGVSRSEDGGKTWNVRYTQLRCEETGTNICITRNIEELPDGTLRLVSAGYDHEQEIIKNLYTCTSNDRGYTWKAKKGSVKTGYPIFKGYKKAVEPAGESRTVINTVNGEGLNAAGLLHDTGFNNMWLSSPTSDGYANPNPGTSSGLAWVRFEFPTIVALDSMWVWNSNQAYETARGLRNVTVEYSVTGGSDSSEWKELGKYEFSRAPGEDDYVGFSAADFAGAKAKYVVVTASKVDGNWGYNDAEGYFYGLSEVRFFAKDSDSAGTGDIVSDITATASGENPWYAPYRGSPSPHEPSWLTLPDGRMLFIGRAEQARIIDGYTPPFLYGSLTETGDHMVITESFDNGQTWSMPRSFTNYGEVHGYLTLLKDGRVLCTYANYHLPYGIFAIFSNDMGKTWDKEHPIQLALSANDLCGWPVTLQLPNGDMITSYAITAFLEKGVRGKVDSTAFQIVKWDLPPK